MLTELRGKGGVLCQQAKDGRLRCPLMIRPTSEDVVTGELFGALSVLNPRWWLSDLMNVGLGQRGFRRQCYRKLRIDLWRNRPRFPSDLLPEREGSTQVDATIRWENPPTTVYVEMKFMAEPARGTVGSDRHGGFAGDQIIRNIRVGLFECGWYQEERLFDHAPRDFMFLLISPESGNDLVARYRDIDAIRASIPNSDQLLGLPGSPFVGEASFHDIETILSANLRFFSYPERRLAQRTCDYLAFKRDQARRSRSSGDLGISPERSDPLMAEEGDRSHS